MLTAFHVLALVAVSVPPEVEIGAWSVVCGVPVGMALAVHEVESGNFPEGDGDGQGWSGIRVVLQGPGSSLGSGSVLAGDPGVPVCLAGRVGIEGHGRTSARRGTPSASATTNAPIPPPTRDTVISRGNVGRMQTNATTFARLWGVPRAQAVAMLQNRHRNIAAGVAYLAGCYARHGLLAPSAYNRGDRDMGDDAGQRYQRQVERVMRRLMAGASRRW